MGSIFMLAQRLKQVALCYIGIFPTLTTLWCSAHGAKVRGATRWEYQADAASQGKLKK